MKNIGVLHSWRTVTNPSRNSQANTWKSLLSNEFFNVFGLFTSDLPMKSDQCIDVRSYIVLYHDDEEETIQFEGSVVLGSFHHSYFPAILSMRRGTPRIVHGGFSITHSRLACMYSNLKAVGGVYFSIRRNYLASLDFVPLTVPQLILE